jgi:transposase
MWVRDRLDGLWRDEDFGAWYPRDGRPGLSPAQLATVSVLQFLLNLSGRQAAEAVRCRIDFKYALALELDDPGFHHSVLSDFRDRLAAAGRADELLDLVLERLKAAGLVTDRGRQRTDSTYILAAARDLTRLELVARQCGPPSKNSPGPHRRSSTAWSPPNEANATAARCGCAASPAIRSPAWPRPEPTQRPCCPGSASSAPAWLRPAGGGAAADHGAAVRHRCPGPAAAPARGGRVRACRQGDLLTV